MRLILVILAVCLSAGASLAQAARTLRVVGIAAEDTLNLREFPTASSRIVGALPPGARGVSFLGSERDGWIFVRWGESHGWALARYLAEDAPIRQDRGALGSAPPPTSGWWLVLGSFSDPAGTPASVARVSERARQCGLRTFSAASRSFATFTPGFAVVVAGPYPSRPVAEDAGDQVRGCLPTFFVKFSAFRDG